MWFCELEHACGVIDICNKRVHSFVQVKYSHQFCGLELHLVIVLIRSVLWCSFHDLLCHVDVETRFLELSVLAAHRRTRIVL